MVRASLGVSLGPLRISTGRRRRRRRPAPARRRARRPVARRAPARRAAAPRPSSTTPNTDALLGFLGLALLAGIVALVVALLMLVLVAAAAGLAIWGIVVFIKWMRNRKQRPAAPITVLDDVADPGDLVLHSHSQVLETFPEELRAAFEVAPAALQPSSEPPPVASLPVPPVQGDGDGGGAEAPPQQPTERPRKTFSDVQVGDVTWMGEVLAIEKRGGNILLRLPRAQMCGRPDQEV